MTVVLICLAVVVVLLAVAYAVMYHGIVQNDNRCDEAWQAIEVLLRNRNELVSSLVEVAQAHTASESQSLAHIAEARDVVTSASTPEEKMVASSELSGALNHLFVLSDEDSKLGADASYVQLKSQISDTEDKISYARMNFNDHVLAYNNSITTFPGNVVAGSRFRPRQGFEVVSDTMRQPKHDFGA